MSFIRSVTALVLSALCMSAAAQEQQQRERFLLYKVERIAPHEAPVIDGRLDEPVWRDKAAISTLRNFLGPLAGDLASQRSEFIILTTGPTIYIGATLYDDDMNAVRDDPAKDPYWNDCVELYFDPRHDGTRSIQLVVDVGGRKFWHKRFDDGYGWWDDRSWHMLARWSAAAARHDDRWTLEIEIDAASFGIDTSPGAVCGFNPCRFRLGAAQPEFSAWGFAGGARQKNMAAWGRLLFGAEGERMKNAPVTGEDIRRVIPDLGDRVLEAPMDEGLLLVTAEGERLARFEELLAPLLAAAEEQLRAAREALDALPADDRNAARLAGDLPPLETEVARLQDAAGARPLTIGAYDRAADGLRSLTDRLHDFHWKARLARLALEAAQQEATAP